MPQYLKSLALVCLIFVVLGVNNIKADTGSTSSAPSLPSVPIPSPSSSSSNASTNSSSSNTSTAGSNKNQSSSSDSKNEPVRKSVLVPSDGTVCTTPSCAAGIVNTSLNVQSASVSVEPFGGSAGLSIPIQVPPGRAGIQPNLSIAYNSSERQLGNAGVSWNLDLGAIQISTKKGVPKYDGTDIFTIEQGGSTQDLVADPVTPGLYHMEVEGAFARIQYFTTYWLITDKKGIKYYYGNTADSTQNDPANPTHIFRWGLNRVEDLNGNYMTISYLQDHGQIYPQTISYTGNDQTSLLLSTYAQVSISYVAAGTPNTSYISKFLVETAQRLDHIYVCAGINTTVCNSTNAQSTYAFTYYSSAYSHRDLLQTVQQIASDGSKMPAVTFSYSDTSPKGFQLDTTWNFRNLPNFSQYNDGIWQDLGVRIADLNGDGYPDIVQYSTPWGGSTTNQSYLNTKQKSWASTGNWQMSWNAFWEYFPGFVTYVEINRYTGVTLLDVDGDGLIDTVQNFKEDMHWGGANFEYTGINNGTNGFVSNSGWNLPADAIIDYELGDPVYEYTVPGATDFGSITGSGYPDVAVSRTDWYPSHNVYINNNEISQGTSGWTLSQVYSTPSAVDFNKGAALVDLNGDGLADIISLVAGSCQVYMNTGNGWTLTNNGYSNTFGLGDLSNATTQFVDVNGDGLPDMVIANGSSNHVLINTGNGWVQDDSWAPQGANFTNLSTQFADFNATGMTGYMISVPGQQQVYMNQGQTADLLIGVNNGIGASTTIQYNSIFHYSNTYMPYFMPVVQSTTTTVGSQSYTTNYNYTGGNWDKNYREFDGFQKVMVTDPDGNYVTSTFLQDHWSKGHPIEQDTYDSHGNLYSKSINTWGTQTIAANSNFNVGAAPQTSKFLYVSRTDNYFYDGNNSATPKRTAQEFSYGESPQYGDVTQTINDGQVDPTAGTSIDPNKTITNVSYVNNTNNWLIGLPSQTVTQDINGNTLSKVSFYYDNDPTGTAAPSLGRLTAKVNWLGSSTQSDPKTTYTYDGYGNLQTTTDPLLNTTTITYDNTVHMFPEVTSNALNQKVMMTYYGIDSTPLNNNGGLQGLWGQSSSKTDANKQTAYTTYDVFGRPLTSISPLDTVALPTEQKSYNIQPTYIEVTDTVRQVNGSTSTISTTSFYDGLGRLIETKSLAPTAGQYIASGQTVYDNRGLPITKYLPRFVSTGLDTIDPIDTTVPNSQVVYDPMGRVISKINPDGTYSSIAYNQWQTTITDENGHQQQSTIDAFGRLVQKQEFMGADGRSPYYPSTPFNLYATTSYAYDPKGDLISVTDAHNNVTTITYDNLGRKIAMNDPDMGVWHYGYDSNGNLIWQQDAKGQVISFKYDALNRLINKTDGISGPIVNLPNVTSQPATFNVTYNFDDPTQNYGIGRLGSVAYDTGTAGFVYDQLGREISSNKSIASGKYNVTRQYDALNRLQQLQYPDGYQTSYTYNQAGQVASVSGQ